MLKNSENYGTEEIGLVTPTLDAVLDTLPQDAVDLQSDTTAVKIFYLVTLFSL